MALDKTKILRGVATVVFNAGVTPVATYTAVKEDSFKLIATEKKAGRELEDGSEYKYEAGGTLQFEMTVSELDSDDIAAIKTADEIVVTFSDITKTLTIDSASAAFSNVTVDIDGLSTKITFWESVAIGTDLGDLIVIA